MKSTKFLGIFIDENLSWNDHISSLCTKVSMNVGVMSRLKWFLPKHILATLYKCFVHHYFNYNALLLPDGAHLHQVVINCFCYRKKAIRIIHGAGYLEHTSPLFATSSILKFGDIHSLNVANFMFKHSRNLLPHKLQGFFFCYSASVHTHQQRESLCETK